MVETRTTRTPDFLQTSAIAARNVTRLIVIRKGLFRSGEVRAALDDVSLDVPAGSIFGIVGGPGSGKTSLLNVLAGETQPDAGEVTRAPGCIWFSDEPTLQELDARIASKPAEQTVVFTTTNAALAEFTCDQVVLLEQGKVLGSGTPASLIDPLPGSVQVSVAESLELSDAQQTMLNLWALPSVTRVVPDKSMNTGTGFEIVCSEPDLVSSLVSDRVSELGWTLQSLVTERPGLQDVFRVAARFASTGPRYAERTADHRTSRARFAWLPTGKFATYS